MIYQTTFIQITPNCFIRLAASSIDSTNLKTRGSSTNDALTGREASHDASFINDYMWKFTNAGVDLPIQPSDYYSIAREANGNTTLCHRTTGHVILFAPDHAFDFVVPFDGCSEYALYNLNGIVTLRDWVDVVARQWLAQFSRSTYNK